MGLLNRKAAGAEGADKCEKEITIVNRLGMHARPAAMFVRIASRFRCEVWVEKEGEQINGKSIMGLMMLAAGQGSKLTIRCEGPDCESAMQKLEQLIASRFNEERRALRSLTGPFYLPSLSSSRERLLRCHDLTDALLSLRHE